MLSEGSVIFQSIFLKMANDVFRIPPMFKKVKI